MKISTIGKNEKMVYFYTKKGIFHKRDSMNALEEVFKEFGFYEYTYPIL